MKKLSDNNRGILITAIILIGLVAVDFFCGYYFGKKSIESKITKKETEIRWVKGETIRDTIFQPKPYETIKNDMKEKVNKINKEISEMIIDSSEEENGNDMPRYNSLYNANFLDDINMILED